MVVVRGLSRSSRRAALLAAVAAASAMLIGCGRVGYDTSARAPLDGSHIDAPAADGGAGTAICGDGRVEGAEACDDGNALDGDACSADCSTRVVCGDGIVAGTEACDDMNGTGGDGCENDCTRTCSDDDECDDGAPCNGIEACDLAVGCRAGVSLPDGSSCGGSDVCRAGACAPVTCGNGAVDAGEECDDMNTTSGDGCENDCTFTCETDPECDDADVCNGPELCDVSGHTCTAGVAPPASTVCDRDGMPATRDICRDGGCFHSVCGDGFVDPGLMPLERCDDANTVDGDGCDNDCTFSCVVQAMCIDTNPCNGMETCNVMTHRCDPGASQPNGAPCSGGTCQGGVCVPAADAGVLADGGMCTPITTSSAAIGRTCKPPGMGDCPPGYTCHPYSGVTINYFCAILCVMDCECPDGTRCVMMSDKGGRWFECV